MPDHSGDAVTVSAELVAASGEVTEFGPMEVRPEVVRPNGPDCPPVVHQAVVTVEGEG